MGKIRILDCTLRDGGRVIDCNFGKNKIQSLYEDLNDANIDIIEIGFLRNNIKYNPESTFFTSFEQISSTFELSQAEIVVFVDCGMFDIAQIPEYDDVQPITGIRYGFTKADINKAFDEIRIIKSKGYKVYVQDVDTLGYTEDEFTNLIDKVNEIEPYSFAIVDTYGAMYLRDVRRYYNLLEARLKSSICLDFHSHNNYQLSFSLAQSIIHFSENSDREIIIDSTLYGMGKVAGNLNTELITDYLNRFCEGNYILEKIFDTIDENIMDIYADAYWGYSANSFLSGKFRAHPNNVIYLTKKFKLDTNDIAGILERIEESKRRTYDYDNIEKCYIDYWASKNSYEETLSRLEDIFGDRTILIVAPGYSIINHERDIENYIENNRPVVISVNFDYEIGCLLNYSDKYEFYANQKRYKKRNQPSGIDKILITSNVKKRSGMEHVLDYKVLIERGWSNFDNSLIMLLKLLEQYNVTEICFAGVDGFRKNSRNFIDESMHISKVEQDYDLVNIEVTDMLSRITKRIKEKGTEIKWLTESSLLDNANEASS